MYVLLECSLYSFSKNCLVTVYIFIAVVCCLCVWGSCHIWRMHMISKGPHEACRSCVAPVAGMSVVSSMTSHCTSWTKVSCWFSCCMAIADKLVVKKAEQVGTHCHWAYNWLVKHHYLIMRVRRRLMLLPESKEHCSSILQTDSLWWLSGYGCQAMVFTWTW